MGDAPIRESTTPSTDGSPRKRSSVQALRERVKRSSVIAVPARGLARLEQRCRAIPLPGQQRAREYYQSNSAQYLFAFLIFGNFVCAMLEKQFDPQSINYRYEFEVVFDVFNTVFLIELLYSNGVGSFPSSSQLARCGLNCDTPKCTSRSFSLTPCCTCRAASRHGALC